MKSAFSAKSIVLLFLCVLALYFAVFYGLEYSRKNKGAWEVNFLTDSQGNPSIAMYQPKLNISSVEVVFAGEKVGKSNASERIIFDRPKKPVPFGKVIYEDLTFLPGVVTFDFFGHEVELLPRVLIVNKREVPWKSDSVVELAATNKPPVPPKPAKGYED
jgi:hypothetical protein